MSSLFSLPRVSEQSFAGTANGYCENKWPSYFDFQVATKISPDPKQYSHDSDIISEIPPLKSFTHQVTPSFNKNSFYYV